MQNPFIVDIVRTPRAKRKGKFSTVHPVDLLAHALKAITSRNKLNPAEIDDVVVGCVTQTGEQGWCVGRKAVLAAGYPYTVPATTVNRLCGSGQQAFNFVTSAIQSGMYKCAIGAGLEHMTRAPMFSDISGEESPMLTSTYPDLVPQGLAAELIAKQYNIRRLEVDEYSLESQKRAARAQEQGFFKKSLIAVPYTDENGGQATLFADDTIRGDTTIEKLSSLKPAFQEDGIVTAGNASAIVDGAAASLLADGESLKRLGLKPRATIRACVSVGSAPRIMLDGPIAASKKALQLAGLKIEQIDLWEVNEAFACVPVMVMRELKLSHDRVNVNGGGVSLGHPLGATGVMLLGTALDELERRDAKFALVTMCIGLGMGIATVIERI